MFFLAWKLPSQLAALCQCVRLPGDRVGPAVASDSAVAPSLESVQSKRFASNDAIADLAVQPATDAGVSDNGAPKTHDYKLGTAQVFQNDPLPDDESSSHERTKPFLPKRMVKCKDQYPIRRKPRIPTNSLGDVSFDPSPIQNKGYLYELATRSTPDRYPELVKPAVANTNGSGSQMPGYVSVGPLEATETSGFKPACPKRNWDFYKVEQSSSHSLYELCAHGNNDFDVLERGRPCHRRDHTGKSGAPENGVEAGETMMQGSCGGDLDTAVKPEEVLCEEKRSPSKKRAREDMKFEEAERKMTNGLRKRDEHNKRTEATSPRGASPNPRKRKLSASLDVETPSAKRGRVWPHLASSRGGYIDHKSCRTRSSAPVSVPMASPNPRKRKCSVVDVETPSAKRRRVWLHLAVMHTV